MKRTKILMMAGGTGGHIFPALAVAEVLREQNIEVAFLGTQHGLESKIIPQHQLTLFTLCVAGLRGVGVKRLIVAPFSLIRAVYQAVKIIRRYQPTAVLGMGGFASGPGGIAAFLLRIPLVLHEQNAIPGWTNKILARFAHVVFTGFPQAFDQRKQVHYRYVGNPIRKALTHLSSPERRFLSREGALRILIVGGSRGAMALNTQIPLGLALLKFPLEIRHQAGQQYVENAKQAYQELGLTANVVPFIDNMAEAYEWADLLICRSGAMTISEITTVGVPAIFVPFPHAVDDHQTANAKFLVDIGAGMLIQQKDLTPKSLAEKLTILNDRKLLMEIARKAYVLRKIDAAEQVAKTLGEY